MEKFNDSEEKSLVDELNKGRELANQLKKHFGPLETKEACEELVEKIVCSYDNALAVLSWRGLLQDPSPVLGLVDSTQSFAADDSKNQCHKKRKTMHRWSKQVKVCKGTGVDSPLDDGYSWRKYGQKEILGAKYPRAYYRCTHRHTKGCAATKLVQRSDEDSSILEVTYRGKHSCIRTSNSISTTDSLEEEKVKVNKDGFLQQLEENQKQEMDVRFQFGQCLKVETEKLESIEDLFPSFSFQSTPLKSENLGSQTIYEPLEDDTFVGSSFYSPFTSPATSEPNYAISLSQINNYRIGHKWPSSENDLIDINSTPTSVTNSPFDLDLSIDQEDFDPNFPHYYHF